MPQNSAKASRSARGALAKFCCAFFGGHKKLKTAHAIIHSMPIPPYRTPIAVVITAAAAAYTNCICRYN